MADDLTPIKIHTITQPNWVHYNNYDLSGNKVGEGNMTGMYAEEYLNETGAIDEFYGGELESSVVIASRPKSKIDAVDINGQVVSGEVEKLTPPKTKLTGAPEITSLNEDGLSVDGIKYKGTEFIKPNKEINQGKNKDGVNNTPLVFFPFYSVENYSADINNWRKQINPFGVKGCFYFKIFFNFDTNYGLLGGTTKGVDHINTALKYLSDIEDLPMYISERLRDRREALEKFITSLKNISIHTPWFFKEVTNLNNINNVPIEGEDFSDQFINIICSEESVDMRLGTLFDLYKFATYNTIRNKEIIPANLRKFEMSILFMHVPLRNYQTSFKGSTSTQGESTKSFSSKGLNFNDNNTENIISAKMLTFQNCEFDVKSMNELPDAISNESSFDMGKNTIKIKYSKVYETRLNEFEKLGFNQEGFVIKTDGNEVTSERLTAISNDIQKVFNNHTKKIIEADINQNLFAPTEALEDELLTRRKDKANPKLRTNTKAFNKKLDELKGPKFKQDNLYGNFTNVRSQYYVTKLKRGKEGTIRNGNIYHYDFERTGGMTNRVNTKYLDKKLDNIKNGTLPGTIGHGTNSIIDYKLAEKNEFQLEWGANALNYSNNMYAVEGNPGTATTFFGKLAESSWQRIKSAFGY